MNDQKLPAISELEDKPENQHDKAKKCFYGKCLIIFASVVSLLALGASLLIGKLLWNEITQLKAKDAIVESILKKVQQDLPEMQNEIKNQQESINEWLNQTKTLKRNWIYRQASYLIKQATYQLRLANLNGAIWLSSDALNVLNTFSSSDADVIKSQLAEVVQILKTTKLVNRDEVINQLDQLKMQVNQLPLHLLKVANSPAANISKNTDAGVLKPLEESWEQIKQLIVIRHHEKPIEPLITPLQDIYLKQNLQLQLEQTVMAVLYRDNNLYHSSLKKINAWVKQFFDPHAETTKSFLKAVDVLLQMDVTPTSPDVFADLNAILNQLDSQVQYRTEGTA